MFNSSTSANNEPTAKKVVKDMAKIEEIFFENIKSVLIGANFPKGIVGAIVTMVGVETEDSKIKKEIANLINEFKDFTKDTTDFTVFFTKVLELYGLLIKLGDSKALPLVRRHIIEYTEARHKDYHNFENSREAEEKNVSKLKSDLSEIQSTSQRNTNESQLAIIKQGSEVELLRQRVEFITKQLEEKEALNQRMQKKLDIAESKLESTENDLKANKEKNREIANRLDKIELQAQSQIVHDNILKNAIFESGTHAAKLEKFNVFFIPTQYYEEFKFQMMNLSQISQFLGHFDDIKNTIHDKIKRSFGNFKGESQISARIRLLESPVMVTPSGSLRGNSLIAPNMHNSSSFIPGMPLHSISPGNETPSSLSIEVEDEQDAKQITNSLSNMNTDVNNGLLTPTKPQRPSPSSRSTPLSGSFPISQTPFPYSSPSGSSISSRAVIAAFGSSISSTLSSPSSSSTSRTDSPLTAGASMPETNSVSNPSSGSKPTGKRKLSQ